MWCKRRCERVSVIPHPGRITEELQEAEVVPGGQQPPVFGERGGVDVGDVAVGGPDALTGEAQNAGPGGPLHLLNLMHSNKLTVNTRAGWQAENTYAHKHLYKAADCQICVCVCVSNLWLKAVIKCVIYSAPRHLCIL